MKKVGKRILSILCAVCMVATLFSSVVMADEITDIAVTLTATSYETDGVIVPTITGLTGEGTYRYLMSNDANAPIEYWEEIVYDNENLSASGAITDVAMAGDEAYLLLSANQADMYVKMEVTQGDNKYYSEATPKIEYDPNKLNNGELNTVGINLETKEVYGWSDGEYHNSTYGLKTAGNTVGNWYNRFDFPSDITAGPYTFGVTTSRTGGAGLNRYTNFTGTSISNLWTVERVSGWNSSTSSVVTTLSNAENAYISFRNKKGSGENESAEVLYMKDFSLIKQAPIAENITFDSEFKTGEAVSVDFEYNDLYDADVTDESGAVTGKVAAGTPEVAWYISDNTYGPWTKLSEEGNGIILPTAAFGKYLKAEVTPVNANGVKGDKRFAVSDQTVGMGNVGITFDATSYETDGVIVPTISNLTGEVTYRYLMSNDKNAPIEYWEEIVYDNENLSASGTIADAEDASGAYLLLSAKQTDMYVKMEVTANGSKYYSEATPKIEYTPNKLNNGELNTAGINLETGEVYGWSKGTYDSARAALKSSGAENGANWYNKMNFPSKLSVGTYVLTVSAAHGSGAGKNYKVAYNDAELSGALWRSGKLYTFETGSYDHTLKSGDNTSIAFRICTGSSAGAEVFYMKDLSLIKQAPVASNVTISGDFKTGEAVSVSYDYISTYDADTKDESGVVTGKVAAGEAAVAWYISDNTYGPWESLSVTGEEITLPMKAYGKYLKAEVTPVNANGVGGDTFFAVSSTSIEAGDVEVLLSAVDGRYTTDGILYPEYAYLGEGEEGKSTYRYLMADTEDAPIEYWEEVVYPNTVEALGATEIKAETAKDAYLLMFKELVGKHIRIEITQYDADGNNQGVILSAPTPKIEYVANVINNPTFSREAVDTKGNPMGWYRTDDGAVALVDDKDGIATSAALAIRPTADEVGSSFRTRMTLPSTFLNYGTQYNISLDVYKITGGSTNFRAKVGNYNMYAIKGGNNSINNVWTNISNTYSSNLNNANSGLFALSSAGSAGGAAGQFNVDNISVTNRAPYASNVKINGTLEAGQTLTATYTYNNEFDGKITETETAEDGTETVTEREALEDGTTIIWYVSDNAYGPWTEIARGEELALKNRYANKYLKATVIAKSEFATAPVAIPTLDVYQVSETLVEEDDLAIDSVTTNGKIVENGTIGGSVKFYNNTASPVYPAILLISYTEDESGNELVDKIDVVTREIAGNSGDEFEASITLGETGAKNVELFIWESMNSIKPLQTQVIYE